MAPFDDPVTGAEESQQALRVLAHATRSIVDPTDIYPILGSLSAAAASLEQSLHQIGVHHDRPNDARRAVDGDARAGRAASYQVAWELRRAGEMVRQVRATIDRAHEIEATIAYDVTNATALVNGRRTPPQSGLSL